MRLVVDLHSHSGYAGGVGKISLPGLAATMRRKGIDVFGTGDCLQPQWLAFLRENLLPAGDGLFQLPGTPGARFLLQTEIILTAPVAGGGRKTVHLVLLMPEFSVAQRMRERLEKWGVKTGMGRPFLVCATPEEVGQRLAELAALHPLIECIPAHILTPDGVYGAENPVNRLADFFGAFAEQIRIVETGLSADPGVLALIPELDDRTLISNSDAHSAALNRVGREFTELTVAAVSYAEIIVALRARKVRRTVEFSPAEGRYYLTGHRAGRAGHEHDAGCYYEPGTAPEVCPICGKRFTAGVLQRALELSVLQGGNRTLATAKPRQEFLSVVPLVEVIAAALGVKGVSTARVRRRYEEILALAGTESFFWSLPAAEIETMLRNKLPAEITKAAVSVRRGEFHFDPPGHDGAYGQLRIGQPVYKTKGKR